jgi:hypothetical protein
MAKRKRTIGQTTVYKTLHRNIKIPIKKRKFKSGTPDKNLKDSRSTTLRFWKY